MHFSVCMLYFIQSYLHTHVTLCGLSMCPAYHPHLITLRCYCLPKIGWEVRSLLLTTLATQGMLLRGVRYRRERD